MFPIYFDRFNPEISRYESRVKREDVQSLVFGRRVFHGVINGIVSRGLKNSCTRFVKWENGAILRVIRHGS